MNNLFDILLTKPIPDPWLHGLLFTSFTLHLLFVLLTIGTAILGLFYFIKVRWSKNPEKLRLDKEILNTFVSHKSIAVVLGVGPLLLIQVGFTVPFFLGIHLFAPFWISIVLLLIFAFLCFDFLIHKENTNKYLRLISGIAGTMLLLVVPGIFAAILTTSEHPDMWLTIIKNNYHLKGTLALHWLFRYLHVLGAALVFGASFHYLFSTKDEKEKEVLQKWIVAGILYQFIFGIMLYTSLDPRPDLIAHLFMFAGVIGASFYLWYIFSALYNKRLLTIKAGFTFLMVILVLMLLVRQEIQYKTYLPLQHKLQANVEQYEETLNPYTQAQLKAYKADIKTTYDKGEIIYLKSCAFCHGEKADGRGKEAGNLTVQPEVISSIRTSPSYLHKILMEGVPGSAMPYFTFFDRNKLYDLIHYLEQKYNVSDEIGAIPYDLSTSAIEEAKDIYAQTCSGCHGRDGKGSKNSQNFKPGPPDFTAFNLSPQRVFNVITEGYTGTMMMGFSTLPEKTRWGLVKLVNDFYTGEHRKGEKKHSDL
jgi:mono/diheme cytochrome c family protein